LISINAIRRRIVMMGNPDQMEDRLCCVFRHFPITTVHAHAQAAAEAAEAAGGQRMFRQMRGTLSAADAPLTNDLLTTAAATPGVDLPSLQEDLRIAHCTEIPLKIAAKIDRPDRGLAC
jgi:protein-disulfide isomerase